MAPRGKSKVGAIASPYPAWGSVFTRPKRRLCSMAAATGAPSTSRKPRPRRRVTFARPNGSSPLAEAARTTAATAPKANSTIAAFTTKYAIRAFQSGVYGRSISKNDSIEFRYVKPGLVGFDGRQRLCAVNGDGRFGADERRRDDRGENGERRADHEGEVIAAVQRRERTLARPDQAGRPRRGGAREDCQAQ